MQVGVCHKWFIVSISMYAHKHWFQRKNTSRNLQTWNLRWIYHRKWRRVQIHANYLKHGWSREAAPQKHGCPLWSRGVAKVALPLSFFFWYCSGEAARTCDCWWQAFPVPHRPLQTWEAVLWQALTIYLKISRVYLAACGHQPHAAQKLFYNKWYGSNCEQIRNKDYPF